MVESVHKFVIQFEDPTKKEERVYWIQNYEIYSIPWASE